MVKIELNASNCEESDMKDRRLRCFVAMAFDNSDTDELYEQFRKSFANQFTIRRIDRINHNNDIDKQIIAEIRSADFVVADLTYARPSVYFEAGYAQGRPIPVIYTARRDHVGRLATDDAKRVHFDLQMRNIISWKTPKDHYYFKKLKARIGAVTGPMLRDRSLAAARESRRKKFGAMSQRDQLKALMEASARTMRKLSFRVTMISVQERPDSSRYVFPYPHIKQVIRAEGDKITVATFSVWSSISKNSLYVLHPHSWKDEDLNLNITGHPPRRIQSIEYVLSPRKVSDHVLRAVFPEASWDQHQNARFTPETIFLPDAKFWRGRREVIWERSTRFQALGMNLIADRDGTRKDGHRAGRAPSAQLTRRIVVVGGIDDLEELDRRLVASIEPLSGID
jgi:nucleoside 2-deoxyribosyltransferase